MTNEIVPLPSENEVVGEIVDDFTLSDTIDRDAKEFGKHIRLGGFLTRPGKSGDCLR